MSEATPPPGPVPAGWYPDPEGGAAPRWWDGSRWAPAAPPGPPPMPVPPSPVPPSPGGGPTPAPKKSRTWLIVLLVLLGAGLLLFGGCAVLAVTVWNRASESLDPAQNERTGLPDGTYVMDPTAHVKVNDRCSYSGQPFPEGSSAADLPRVTVVGEGPRACGSFDSDVGTVTFTVTDGTAEIVDVRP